MRHLTSGLAAAAVVAAIVWLGGELPAWAGAQTAAPVDFSGRWGLAEQETQAPRRRGALGNHEEPVVILQTADRLAVRVESNDSAGPFEYDLTGREFERVAGAVKISTTSSWDGRTLVTKGRRLFTWHSGPEVHAFEERRSLSADHRRMTVETTIDLWFENLRRRSVYTRLVRTPPSPQ